MADELAALLNPISSEFQGLEEGSTAVATGEQFPPLTHLQVVARLWKFKKPKSKVRGDIFPDLVTKAATTLSGPLVNIYNETLRSGSWPPCWKTEFVNPIPRVPPPQSANDLREVCPDEEGCENGEPLHEDSPPSGCARNEGQYIQNKGITDFRAEKLRPTSLL